MTPERLSFLAAIILDRCPIDVRADLYELVAHVEADLGVHADPYGLRRKPVTGTGGLTVTVAQMAALRERKASRATD